jgi:hypothetical protein
VKRELIAIAGVCHLIFDAVSVDPLAAHLTVRVRAVLWANDGGKNNRQPLLDDAPGSHPTKSSLRRARTEKHE